MEESVSQRQFLMASSQKKLKNDKFSKTMRRYPTTI